MERIVGLTKLPKVFQRVLIGLVLVIAVGMVLSGRAFGAPKMTSERDCAMAADMALVAMALAAAKVDVPRASVVMDLVYDTSESEVGAKLKAIVLRTAYGLRASGTAPGNFSAELYRHCVRSGGDLDGILGMDL